MTNEEAKVFLDNLKICIEEHPIVADWLVEIADRKTENCSEKPNNCEPQTKYPCDTCANKGDHDGECSNCVSDSETIRWKMPSHYKPKDKPQTEEWYTFQDEQEYNARHGKE